MKPFRYPRLLLPTDFDERAAFEITLKGWVSARVEAEDGAQYPIYFCDPTRLQQDLDTLVLQGEPCVAEPGLVILPEVTVEAAEHAVQFLWRRGFFASLKAEYDNEQPTVLESMAA